MSAPARILVLDDEERIRQLLVDFLEDFEEFTLRACASAEEALEELAREPADLCIVDVRLPGMDGKDFILNARKRGLCGRFLLHTGSVDFSLGRELLVGGMEEDDVFFKPCDMAQMLERIRYRLAQPGAQT